MFVGAIRRLAIVPVIALTTLALAACEDGTEPDDTLVGDFTASEAVFTDNADANNTFDVIEAEGTLDMDFRDDGTFRSELALPDRDPVVRTGNFVVDGTTLRITEAGQTRTATFERDGGALQLTDPATAFDFGAGPAPATLEGTFLQR